MAEAASRAGDEIANVSPSDITVLWRALSSRFVAVSLTMRDRAAMVASPCGADLISRKTRFSPSLVLVLVSWRLTAFAAAPPCGCWCSTLFRRYSTTVKVSRRRSKGTGN